jgi:glutaryl-CoA dehydrogenase (non-decarboxylating)
MGFKLGDPPRATNEPFRRFCDNELVPFADEWDREERLPRSLIDRLAAAGWLVSTLPKSLGGAGHDNTTHGMLVEEIGRGCQSVRNLIAVQGMVAHATARWGRGAQKECWPARIGSGAAVAAFALTEPEGGSAAREVRTRALRRGDVLVLDGRKKWISFAAIADVFLVIAQLDGHIAAILVEAGTAGVSVRPIGGMLGLRASHLGEITFAGCEVPAENVVAHGALAFNSLVTEALNYGRFSTACGCVGLAQACLFASARHASRGEGERRLDSHQLVRAKLTDMVVRTEAARLLCRKAAWLRDQRDPQAIAATLAAKYFASTAAHAIASDAVQLHGAAGCSPEHPVQRYLRDGKIQEIIEGASELHQSEIAKLVVGQIAGRGGNNGETSG